MVPGEGITSEQGYLRGHGTYIEGEELIACVAGQMERVNKLISVKPLKSRFIGEMGDLVVGRITYVERYDYINSLFIYFTTHSLTYPLAYSVNDGKLILVQTKTVFYNYHQ